MGTVLLLGLLVGLDNLQVGAALGLAGLSPARRWAFACAFALCEAAMPLVGLLLGSGLQRLAGPSADTAGALVLALCGGTILFFAFREEETAALAESRLALVGLPLTLSFDNLFAGLGLGSLGYPVLLSAAAIGGVSGALCFLGLFAGERARRWVPRRAEVLSGAYLLALAVFRLVEGWA